MKKAGENLYRKWAQINVDKLQYNYDLVKLTTKSKVLCVVKAHAYGHGLIETAKYFESFGADYLGVSSLGEALRLREAKIKCPILVMGYIPPANLLQAVERNITITVTDHKTLKELSKLGKRAKVHIKINSGMNRLGFSRLDKSKIFLPNIEVEGIFSHFACEDYETCKKQYDRFMKIIKGIDVPIKHISNSNAIFKFPEFDLDMVRAGICLYGYGNEHVKPALSLKAIVTHSFEVKKGEGISYEFSYKAKENEKIAVIPVGYADGVPRILSNNFSVKIGRKEAPSVGNICMDMFMVKSSAKVGTEVIVYDDVTELAKKAGTITYEMLTSIAERIPRVYLKRSEKL